MVSGMSFPGLPQSQLGHILRHTARLKGPSRLGLVSSEKVEKMPFDQLRLTEPQPAAVPRPLNLTQGGQGPGSTFILS